MLDDFWVEWLAAREHAAKAGRFGTQFLLDQHAPNGGRSPEHRHAAARQNIKYFPCVEARLRHREYCCPRVPTGKKAIHRRCPSGEAMPNCMSPGCRAKQYIALNNPTG